MTEQEQNIFKASFAQLYAKKIEKQVKEDILNLSRRTGQAISPSHKQHYRNIGMHSGFGENLLQR